MWKLGFSQSKSNSSLELLLKLLGNNFIIEDEFIVCLFSYYSMFLFIINSMFLFVIKCRHLVVVIIINSLS